MDSFGPSPASSTTTCSYVLAFTEGQQDCLLCPEAYFINDACVAMANRKPYPFIRTLRATSWEDARAQVSSILEAFEVDLTDGKSSVYGAF